jgi:hypothetical protein
VRRYGNDCRDTGGCIPRLAFYLPKVGTRNSPILKLPGVGEMLAGISDPRVLSTREGQIEHLEDSRRPQERTRPHRPHHQGTCGIGMDILSVQASRACGSSQTWRAYARRQEAALGGDEEALGRAEEEARLTSESTKAIVWSWFAADTQSCVPRRSRVLPGDRELGNVPFYLMRKFEVIVDAEEAGTTGIRFWTFRRVPAHQKVVTDVGCSSALLRDVYQICRCLLRLPDPTAKSLAVELDRRFRIS